MARARATSVPQLVDAAARVFERKGYPDATIDDIAAEAGVTKPTVYQYVRSKQWLLEAIVEQVIYPLRDRISEVLAAPAPPRQKLLDYLRLQVEAAGRLRVYYAVVVSGQQQLSPAARRRYRAWAHDVNRDTLALLQECADAGVVRADLDLRIVVPLLNGMLTSIHEWFRPSGRLDVDGVVHQVLGLLSGLVLPDEPPRRGK